ncbi:uncharacterized protein BKA78DRAFT_78838 [Phyllosticta capitalensis]|uniref:uncharacterized protein n=1 Tax=Phyllosticta capitalensis TaxID=121624 RepID=UPI0031326F7A
MASKMKSLEELDQLRDLDGCAFCPILGITDLSRMAAHGQEPKRSKTSTTNRRNKPSASLTHCQTEIEAIQSPLVLSPANGQNRTGCQFATGRSVRTNPIGDHWPIENHFRPVHFQHPFWPRDLHQALGNLRIAFRSLIYSKYASAGPADQLS